MVYSKEHKMLLQTILHEGFLDENKAKDLVIKLFNENNVSAIINQINEQLQPVNMLIKKGQCEITGQVHWVFISTVIDDVTKYQEEFSKGQLALLRNIFSEIIISSNGSIQSTECLNFCSLPDVKLSKTETEEFLNDVVTRKWLAYKEGYYYMGVRSITELMPYFKATYGNNLSTCYLCKQIIFHGEKCNHCQNLLHLYCLKKFTMVHNLLKCPNCNTSFSDIDLSDVIDNFTPLMDEDTKSTQASRKMSRNKNK
ncbi:SMC5-SMC6 complex component Non-SMC element 1 isoform X2 [Calliopsis andreniformis]